MFTKQKRIPISLETKYKVIRLLDKKTPNNEILNQFKSELRDVYNISKIKKNREKIIREFETSTSAKVKSLKKSDYPLVEKGLIDFISECNTLGVPVNTLLIKAKANELAVIHNITGFKCSNGFVTRFKARNGITFQVSHGDAEGVSDDICNEWVNNKLPEFVKDYKPEDIFNGDEFGLFWRIPPNKSFVIKGKKFKTGKKSRERVSVFICANVTGKEKL
jgi:hypothetical protein